MTPEGQRIAIAEACGWKPKHGGDWDNWLIAPSGFEYPPKDLPDYLNDLNAMHEAEKVILSLDLVPHYLDALFSVVGNQYGKRGNDVMTNSELALIVGAPAAQRAEAFLLAIGKWVDA